MTKGPRRGIELTGRIRGRVHSIGHFWKAVAVRAQRVEITFLAAAVAYYAFLSLLPVLLLILSAGSALGGEMLANALVVAAGDLLTPSGQMLVREALDNAVGRAGATVAGVALLLWSMLKVFRGLDIAFLKVYGAEENASLKDQITDGVVAVVGVGSGLAAMVAVGAFVSAFSLDPIVDVLGILVLPTVLTAVFLPLYFVFPDTDVSVRGVLPGTVFAAIGWTVLQAGFQIYAANAGQYQAYGVLGGVLLLVIWFYLAAIVLLLGAVVNAVRSDHGTEPIGILENDPPDSGDRQLQHPPGPQGNTTPMESDEDRTSNEEMPGDSRSDEQPPGSRLLRSDGGSPVRDDEDGTKGSEESGVDEEPTDSESHDEDRVDSDSDDEKIPSWKGGSKSTGDRGEPESVDGKRANRDRFSDESRAFGEGNRDRRDESAGGDDTDDDHDDGVDPAGAPDITELQREVDRLQSQLDEFEQDVDSRTVERPKLESELKRYVRGRMRRGHARGWGPYLVLLYGTILTLGAFYWLDGIYAIGAMIILALSTLGLYVLFVMFGIGLNLLDIPFRAIDAYRRRRE